jgi:ABC-2 type transport system permease protein
VIQSVIFIVVGVLILGANVIGSYWLILICVVLGALMFLGLGFTISGISKTVDSVPAFANLIAFPMMFLGGIFFPISGMPEWLQKAANFLPLTFFSDALREIMTKGAIFSDISADILGMAAWSVIFIALAVKTFGFQEKQNM